MQNIMSTDVDNAAGIVFNVQKCGRQTFIYFI